MIVVTLQGQLGGIEEVMQVANNIVVESEEGDGSPGRDGSSEQGEFHGWSEATSSGSSPTVSEIESETTLSDSQETGEEWMDRMTPYMAEQGHENQAPPLEQPWYNVPLVQAYNFSNDPPVVQYGGYEYYPVTVTRFASGEVVSEFEIYPNMVFPGYENFAPSGEGPIATDADAAANQ